MSSAAREEVLRRVRTAIGSELVHGTGSNGSHPPAAREVPELPDLSAFVGEPRPEAERIARFAERTADYRATVQVVAGTEAAAAIADACARNGVARLLVPDGLDAALVPGSVTAVPALPGDRASALAFAGPGVDGLLAQAPLAIAETGTIVFDAGPGQGPRAASLLPDLLIAVVPAAAIVDGVPEAVARMADVVRATARPLTLVSGPSATSDIELDRVEGVHGPRTLEVVVVT